MHPSRRPFSNSKSSCRASEWPPFSSHPYIHQVKYSQTLNRHVKLVRINLLISSIHPSSQVFLKPKSSCRASKWAPLSSHPSSQVFSNPKPSSRAHEWPPLSSHPNIHPSSTWNHHVEILSYHLIHSFPSPFPPLLPSKQTLTTTWNYY
jgi:hypothetical protein